MRHHDSVIAGLAATPLFAACGRRELQQISRAATVVQVTQGSTLAAQGKVGHDFAIVLDGVARIDVGGRTVATVGPGESFGEMALLDDGPRTASVIAASAMTLAVVGRREFDDLLDRSPVLARSLLTGLARRLRDAPVSPDR